MSKSKILSLVCVYKGSTSLVNRTFGLLGRQVITGNCALAQLTSNNMKPSEAWAQYIKTFPVSVQCVYENQAEQDLYYLIRKNTPCVIAICNYNQKIILLDKNDLMNCHSDIGLFDMYIQTAVKAKFLTF